MKQKKQALLGSENERVSLEEEVKDGKMINEDNRYEEIKE